MTQSAKFTFQNLASNDGRQFDANLTHPKKRSYTDAQIKEIQESAFAEGVMAGKDSALLSIEKQAEESLEKIFSQYSKLISSITDQIDLLHVQSAELALLIAKKLASALINEKPTAEIEKLFLSCVSHLNAEPRIVIRVDEALIDILKEKIERMALKSGYPGRVVIIGETGVNPAECQIEWADGGVTYRSSEQLADIDQMIAEYLDRSYSKNSSNGMHSFNPDFNETDVNQLVTGSTK